MTSNVAQSYPYTSESNADRAARLEASFAAHEGLHDKVAAETIALGDDERWWVWKCPACPGLLHAAGYHRDIHAVYVVCDSCGRTFLR